MVGDRRILKLCYTCYVFMMCHLKENIPPPSLRASLLPVISYEPNTAAALPLDILKHNIERL